MKVSTSDKTLPQPTVPPSHNWLPIALASAILMIAMGIRQTVGLFVHPIVSATAMNIAEMSMALAIGQLMWGVFQPIFGAWADKKGALPVLITGALLLATGQLYTVYSTSFLAMTLAQGILSPAGAAAGSFSVVIGIVVGRLAADKRSVASGIINAGGSAGQFIFSPMVQAVISFKGYTGGLIFLSLASLASIIPAWLLCRKNTLPQSSAELLAPPTANTANATNTANTTANPNVSTSILPNHLENPIGLKQQVRIALRDPSYLLLNAGFFTCGFHVAFLTTHLPGEISLCGHAATVSAISLSLIGLCNIAGSIGAGILGKYYRMKFILSAAYAFRALMITVYLFSPKTELTFYIFAITTGLTWLATVPPTAGIVGKLFGTRYLATLFGLTLFTHQIGGFLGAWLGGVAIQTSGNLTWVWWIDIILASIAALVNLPIREEKP